MSSAEPDRHLSRRGLLGLAGAGAAGLALGGGIGAGVGVAATAGVIGASSSSDPNAQYPFYGTHQAGIVTPAQDRLHFAAFDMVGAATRADLISLLADWTAAAVRLTTGQQIGDGAVPAELLAPADDTGEALGLPPSGLTLTFGFGPTLFTDDGGTDRFHLAARTPPLLTPLPRFTGDALVPTSGGGDLCIQACADDPQVAVHAIRNLSRIAFGRASLRWSQLGFGRTSSTSTSQVTPRNLFGFKDGTANIKVEESSDVDADVWVNAADGPAWLAGGSYLVARKIRMVIENWDHAQLGEQERVIGRDKGEGAPLSGGTEFTEPDFHAKLAGGGTRIDQQAHVRLAHPDFNGGIRILRRGYNFVDGNDELGRLNAGLFFISFQRSPEQFITIQKHLARDAMGEYVKHVGSAIFAVPPGIRAGQSIGHSLFG